MVAVEDGTGFMTAYHHRYPFGNPCSNHIPDSRSSEVVDNFTSKPSLSASPVPAFVVVHDGLSLVVEHQRVVRIQGKVLLPLLLKQGVQFVSQVD
jgi:hypothetical protein